MSCMWFSDHVQVTGFSGQIEVDNNNIHLSFLSTPGLKCDLHLSCCTQVPWPLKVISFSLDGKQPDFPNTQGPPAAMVSPKCISPNEGEGEGVGEVRELQHQVSLHGRRKGLQRTTAAPGTITKVLNRTLPKTTISANRINHVAKGRATSQDTQNLISSLVSHTLSSHPLLQQVKIFLPLCACVHA